MSNKKIYLILLIVTIITSGSSIWYLTTVAHNSNTENAKAYPGNLTSTAHDNVVLTENLVNQRVFSLAEKPPFTPTSWRTPGYPLFALPFYLAFNSFYPILFVQILTLFITVILIFKMVEKMTASSYWALGASIVYLLLPDTMLAASAITTENLFVFFFIIALYLFFFSEQKNIYLKGALTGFLLALATYVREASFYILLFFIPAYFLLYLKPTEISRKHIITGFLIVLIFASSVLPWFIRNEKVFGVFAFASTGSNVLLRQNAAQFYQSISGLNAVDSRNALLKMAGLPPGTVPNNFESAPALTKVALEVIAAHPFRYALFHLSTFIPFFTSSGAHEYWRFTEDMRPDFNPQPEPSLIQALNPFSLSILMTVIKNHGWDLLENIFWAIIALLALAGAWWSKDLRLNRMFLAIIFYFAIITGPLAHARYRIPVEPLLLLCAFSAAHFIWSRYGKGWRFNQ